MLENPHRNYTDNNDAGPQNDDERLLLRVFRLLSPQDRKYLMRLVAALESTAD